MEINLFKKAKFERVTDEFRKHPDNTDCFVQLPTRATQHSVAYDIYAPVDYTIMPHCDAMIWTDIKAKFPRNMALLVNVRSSMGKSHIQLANTQGWIESDYYGNESNDGNIGIMLSNFGDEPYEIKCGDRIAQCMLIKYYTFANGNTKKKRKGGFGSSNK
jgi:dUTP pyrophosphatase